jgi:hypothetical protein
VCLCACVSVCMYVFRGCACVRGGRKCGLPGSLTRLGVRHAAQDAVVCRGLLERIAADVGVEARTAAAAAWVPPRR